MENKTVAELRDMARFRNLSGYSRMRKDELITLLSRSRNPAKHPMNKFFDKILVINLDDKVERAKKMKLQFAKYQIKYERFSAVDGRCNSTIPRACARKRRELEERYGVKISKKLIVPAASLTIGTILILREMVKNKWNRILICEDDIVLDKDIEAKFIQGIKSLPANWDLLYLGCGNQCGNIGVSDHRTRSIRNESTLNRFIDEDIYVKNKLDLRVPCIDGCSPTSHHLTVPYNPGGTWCYGYSLKGARKILKFIGDNVDDHIDQLLGSAVRNGIVKVYAFDPPIVWHMEGAIRTDTDIPWRW